MIAAPARRPSRLPAIREKLLDVSYPLIAVAILLIGWELWVRLTHQPRYIMVPFSDVISACWDGRGQLLHHTWVTTVESVYGFVLAAAIGIPLAFGIVSLRPVQKGIFPLIVVYHVIPTIAIAPLLSTWFGFGMTPKLLIVANFAFFPIMLNTIIGLRSTQPLQVQLFRVTGANTWQTFWKLRMPNALPQIFVGLKIASTLAVIGAVVAEYVSASAGLGYYVLLANGNLDTKSLMTGVVYLSILGSLFFGAMQLVERLATPWHLSQRSPIGR